MSKTETSGSMGSNHGHYQQSKSASQGAVQVLLCNMHETNLHTWYICSCRGRNRSVIITWGNTRTTRTPRLESQPRNGEATTSPIWPFAERNQRAYFLCLICRSMTCKHVFGSTCWHWYRSAKRNSSIPHSVSFVRLICKRRIHHNRISNIDHPKN
jgi:hypothetical protein